DDSLGKCFHPHCGRFLTVWSDRGEYRYNLTRVLDVIYHDWHQALLQLPDNEPNALTYLQQERHIHPQVVTDAMLGVVPSSYDVTPHFVPVMEEAQDAIDAQGPPRPGRLSKAHQRAQERLTALQDAQQKLIDCYTGRAGWLVFFYTNASHHCVALRLRL